MSSRETTPITDRNFTAEFKYFHSLDDRFAGTGDTRVGLLAATTRQRSISTPELDDTYSARKTTSSCQALRHALLTLYRLDDFIMEDLGNGFFSDVYKVTHMVTGEVMVLKMNTNKGNRPNVLREVQLMNKMSHPNILKFLGVCVHEGQLHALTEFVNGGNLHDIISNKTEILPWADRVKIAADIAAGMKYLHSEGIFHRDLTSRNILISVDGENKKAIVGDFGLAAKIPSPHEEFHLSVVGSPYWMSPECIHGKRYDQRSDVFSFGIILCELIARIDADPDEMPRTENFGLDYVAYSTLVDDCPLHLLYLAFTCCQMDPAKRPTFDEIVSCLETIKEHRLVLPHTNPIAAKSHIAVGHVRRHIHKFSNKDAGHKRSKSAGQSLDFLQTAAQSPSLPTAQFIGEHMTKEDPFYKPSPANTNPFESKANLKDGRKLLASGTEAELHLYDNSMTLPIIPHYELVNHKQSQSLPDSPGVVRQAIAQFNSQIVNSREARDRKLGDAPTLQLVLDDDDSMSIDSAVDVSSYRSGVTGTSQGNRPRKHSRSTSNHNKQLNLECAMLFYGLDLIQVGKSKHANDGQFHKPSTDLESEFQDDLEDVLRSCSSSESWISMDEIGALSPAQSYYNDNDYEWWKYSSDKPDQTARYLHPTLVEKRRQLRRVECRSKEKIEQLQQKLDQLKMQTGKKSRSYSSASSLSTAEKSDDKIQSPSSCDS